MAAPKPALAKDLSDDLQSSSSQRIGGILQEAAFVQLLRRERRRSERTERAFLLALLSSEDFSEECGEALVSDIVASISSCTRETDVIGWYEEGVALGILLTDMGRGNEVAVCSARKKISDALQAALSPEQASRLTIVFRVFPENSAGHPDDSETSPLYPDLSSRHDSKPIGRIVKRTLDILGSLSALIVLLPLFAGIALLIKLTSKGPVLFRQTRVGQNGRMFTFFKFRSMHVDNDPRVHQEYVARLIAGGDDLQQADGTFKLTNDHRVTAFGRCLRKTSLDELPQFVNVLRGDLSLVGPRPPLPYEYERYLTWHRRRVLEMRPGLTGLWQVEGRSRTTFDEMVRMDLRYAKTWSTWLDCKILLRTPAAMFSGDGAC